MQIAKSTPEKCQVTSQQKMFALKLDQINQNYRAPINVKVNIIMCYVCPLVEHEKCKVTDYSVFRGNKA